MKLCSLVAWDLFDVATSINNIEKIYNYHQIEMLKDFGFKGLIGQLKADVFESKSEITKEQWLQNISEKCNWLFDPKLFRQKLCEKASIPFKHIKNLIPQRFYGMSEISDQLK